MKERVFDALWFPRFYGHDQAIALGQVGLFDFRAPPGDGVMLAAGLDNPRYPHRCGVIGIKHDVLGRIQAVEVSGERYRLAMHAGELVEVDAHRHPGQVLHGLEDAPPDWTLRVTLVLL